MQIKNQKLLLFCHQKKTKTKQRTEMLYMNFFPPPMLLWRGTSIPYFNISTPFLSYPRFSQRTFQLPGQNKQNHKRTYNYQPSPSGLTPMLHPIYISLNSLGFSLPPDCFILLQTRISHHGCETFSNLWCSDYWKIYVSVKKLNLLNLIYTIYYYHR